MRIFVSIILFIVFIFSLVYLLLFTNSGNNLLKPYVKKEIEKRIDNNVTINSMILKPDFVDFEIVVDKKSKFILNGDINMFKQSFNLNYEIDAKNLKTPYMYIKNRLQLTGKIIGNLKEYSVNGKGEVFRAKTSFLTAIKDKKIEKLKIDAKNVEMEELLSLLNKPIYAQGMLDFSLNVTSTDGTNFNGTTNSIIHYGVLNNKTIQKDFGIKLGEPVGYKGKISSKIKDGLVYSTGNIFSNIAQLKFKQSEFNIANQNLSVDYDLFLPNLDLLKSIIGKKLIGKIRVNGNLNIKDKQVSLKAKIKKFGGSINISLLGKTAQAHFINLRAQEIFKMLDTPRFFYAKVDGDIDFSDIYSLDSQADLRIHDGKFSTDKIKELLNIDLPANNNFSLHINSVVSDHNLSAKSDFVSNIFNLQNNKIMYNIDTKTYSGDYILYINKLSNIEFLTKMKLRGKLGLSGNFAGISDKFKIDGKSKFLDSNSTFLYKDNLLNVNIKNLSSIKLSHVAYVPEIFSSLVNANVNYNVLNKIGKFHAVAKEGNLKKGDFSDLIFAITKFDLTQELYDESVLNGNINGNVVNFSLLMNGKNSYLKIPTGYINLKTKQTNSMFSININKKDISGEIKGSIYKPKININSSEYIKNKIEKTIEKKAPKELIKPLKNLLQLFN